MQNLQIKNSTYSIQNLSFHAISSLNTFHTSEINYLLDFLKSHEITQLSLNDVRFIALTLFDHNSDTLNILKIIIILTYAKFNNLTLSPKTFNSLSSQLKIKNNLFLDLIFDNSQLQNIIYYYQ